jgi:predicted ATP-binding protein involved in virulence
MFVIFDDKRLSSFQPISEKAKPEHSAFMSQKKNNSNNSEKPQNAYFLSLELENVRCFSEKQKIDFSDGNGKPRQWTIILGDNGTGKTTILQSLVATIPTSFHSNLKGLPSKRAILPNVWEFRIEEGSLIKRDNPSTKSSENLEKYRIILSKKDKLHSFFIGANISIQDLIEKRSKESVIELSIDDNGYNTNIGDYNFVEVKQNCSAYGASRKVGRTSISEQNNLSSYTTLFNEIALLVNPEEWLLQADYAASRDSEFKEKRRQKLNQIKEILIKVLPDIDEIRINDKETEGIPFPTVEFHTPYGWVEVEDLSLGYRTSMAWMVDFASRMFDLYPESENPLVEPAVVLIDEIDLHLHPKWQRELIDYLTNLFPNTQFIVTTHSPLIVQAAAARDANIVVCRREGDHVVIDQSVEAVRGWRADQILTSDLFDLPSTRDTELEKLEKQRREILSKAKITKADEKKLKTLSAELDDLRVMENAEDDKAMDIIRRAAAHLQNGKK